MAQVRTIDAATARRWLDAGEAALFDVRDPEEHARERIGGASLLPLPTIRSGRRPEAPGRRLVFHCRSGQRSAEACAALADAGAPEVYSLAGGIEAWKAAGLPVDRRRGVPISVMRQVQITAGSLVAIGVALGALLSPWWLVLPAFIGCGLVFSGASGTCGMAAMLSLLPWNRRFRCAAPA